MPRVRRPDDPDRCQASMGTKQCEYLALPGSSRCEDHTRELSPLTAEKRQYLLDKAAEKRRLFELSTHEQINSLREEIAIARRLVERRFNMIDTDADLLAACGPLNTLLLTIERLVKTSHSIEKSLGVMLSRETVLSLAQSMVVVIMDELQHVPDYETIVDRVIDKLMCTVSGVDDPNTVEAEFERTDTDD